MDIIRRLGNLGAHATDERVDEASARRALRFTTQVLKNLFEIPGELAAPEPEEAPKQPMVLAGNPPLHVEGSSSATGVIEGASSASGVIEGG